MMAAQNEGAAARALVMVASVLMSLAGVEGAVDGVEGLRLWRAVIDDGIGDLAERPSDGTDPGDLTLGRGGVVLSPVTQSVRSLAVDDATFDEPRQRVAEGLQALARETVLEVIGVQEVERVLEVDIVRVVAPRERSVNGGFHAANHYIRVDRLRARGYSTRSNR